MWPPTGAQPRIAGRSCKSYIFVTKRQRSYRALGVRCHWSLGPKGHARSTRASTGTVAIRTIGSHWMGFGVRERGRLMYLSNDELLGQGESAWWATVIDAVSTSCLIGRTRIL